MVGDAPRGGERAEFGVTTSAGLGGVNPEGTERQPESPGTASVSGLPMRFGRNVFMNYAAQGLTALSALVLTPILLHHLGKTTYGLWVVASGAVVYLELFELGFGGATTKLIAEDASVRPEEALRTLNTTFFVLVPLGLIALAFGVGLAFVLPHLIHVSNTLHNDVIVVDMFGKTHARCPSDRAGNRPLEYLRELSLGLASVNCRIIALTTCQK